MGVSLTQRKWLWLVDECDKLIPKLSVETWSLRSNLL